MRIDIGMTGWRRPGYFASVIERLSRCSDVGDFTCLASIDGGYPQQQDSMRTIFEHSGLRGDIHMHPENLGCAGNTGFLFNTLFASGADAVIMLEDDTVPSVDFLCYARAMLQRFADDERVFSVSGYHRRIHADSPELAPPPTEYLPNGMVSIRMNLDDIKFTADLPPTIGPGRPDRVFFRDYFTSWGWATWRRVYEEIGDGWFGVNSVGRVAPDAGARNSEVLSWNDRSPYGTWALPMAFYWRRGRCEVAPDLSRIQNIGAEEGMFCPRPGWHRKNHHTEIWMNGDDGYYGPYTLIEE